MQKQKLELICTRDTVKACALTGGMTYSQEADRVIYHSTGKTQMSFFKGQFCAQRTKTRYCFVKKNGQHAGELVRNNHDAYIRKSSINNKP